jgi:mRNA-degrading endonuclease YafQ of YafQ-DinJ toxin-antitoxin module
MTKTHLRSKMKLQRDRESFKQLVSQKKRQQQMLDMRGKHHAEQDRWPAYRDKREKLGDLFLYTFKRQKLVRSLVSLVRLWALLR